MNKNYFPHDTGARNDEKLIKLQKEIGLEAVAIYWFIIEMLYENGGFLNLDFDLLTFNMRLDSERNATVKRIITEFDLFKINGQQFTNKRVIETLNFINSKSEKARKSAKIRWKTEQANAMRTQCEGNAKKKRKVNKENKSSETSSEEDFSLEKELEKLKQSERKDLRLVGYYFWRKKLVIPTRAVFRKEMGRALAEAKTLKDYDSAKIKTTMDYADANFPLWTLETIGKLITKVK